MVNLKVLPLAVFAAALFASSAAIAQTASPAPAAAQASMAPEAGAPHHHHRNKMMSALRQLNLSEDQKAKLKEIMTSYRASRSSATPESHEQMRSQVEGVLTPAQRTQFEAAMKAHPGPEASPAP